MSVPSKSHLGQELVAKFRAKNEDVWHTPPIFDTWAYIVTEVGELGDALLRLGYGLMKRSLRTHAESPDLAMELGDVYLMLCTLANHLSIDLDVALTKSLEKVENTIRRRRFKDGVPE